MKKVILVVAMLLATNLSVSAENLKSNETNRVEAYDVNVNVNSLARYLSLSKDQFESVKEIQNVFSEGLKCASVMETEDSRKRMVNNTLSVNIRNMSYVLTNEQYKKYLKVLNQTMNNRGIER